MRKIEFDLVTTRTGDGGKTSDYSGTVAWKDAAVFDLLGDLDELNSWLGVVKNQTGHRSRLETVQAKLIDLGSLVATDPESPLASGLRPLAEADVAWLELWEKVLLDAGVEIKPAFVLPGETEASAWTDVARTVCRRAERRLVRFIRDQPRPDLRVAASYLNRLSDLLFILARSLE